MEEDKLTSAFRRIGARLRLSVSRITGSADDADDALQEAFFRLWRRRSEITADDQAERLLSVSARNAGIDILRQRAHFTDAEVPEVADSNEAGERAELLEEVTLLIGESLSEEHRQILYERDRNGWDIADIAEAHGLTESNVRMILSRSRRRVRELYIQRNKNNSI